MHTPCEIVEKSPEFLADYGTIPIRFQVKCVLDVKGGDDPACAVLEERFFEHPWIKDYDAESSPQNSQKKIVRSCKVS